MAALWWAGFDLLAGPPLLLGLEKMHLLLSVPCDDSKCCAQCARQSAVPNALGKVLCLLIIVSALLSTSTAAPG